MKLVILDRDGVINVDSDFYIKSVDEWQAIPDSLEAIAQLNRLGYQVVVASNQSGLGRGLFGLADLEAMHLKLSQQLAAVGGKISKIFYCPHAPADACDCRKPQVGLFTQISTYFQSNLNGVYSIGDSLRDLEASLTVNALPVLVLTGKGQKTQQQLAQLPVDNPLTNTPVYANLATAVQQLFK